MLKQIKHAYQRVVRGWDDTALWGLDDHFRYTVVPPLKTFCEDYLNNSTDELLQFNPDRAEIYRHTLTLINAYENQTIKEEIEGTPLRKLAFFFGEHICWYWD